MSRVESLTRAWLRRHPLPEIEEDGDKHSRGSALLIGGSRSIPGAIILGGVAALRSGAGKLQLATVASASVAVGIAVPESLALGLAETRDGEIAASASAKRLRPHAKLADAILVGPGMKDGRSARSLVRLITREMHERSTIVVDALAISALGDETPMLNAVPGRSIVTPNFDELAALLDVDVQDVAGNPVGAAALVAERTNGVVALRGPESWIVAPRGRVCRYTGGTAALGTSGSGDVLAGIVCGLAARGADAFTAACWGVFLHGQAGRESGPPGFLARDLAQHVPALIARISG